MNHSPGPWHLEKMDLYEGGKANQDGLQILDANGDLVADNQTYYPHPLAAENAALIAAAPELYDALKKLVGFAHEAGFPCDYAETILAKIEGP